MTGAERFIGSMGLWSILSFSYFTNTQGQRGPVRGLYIDKESISALESEKFITLLFEWMGWILLHIHYAVMFPGKCELRTNSWWYVAFVGGVSMPYHSFTCWPGLYSIVNVLLVLPEHASQRGVEKEEYSWRLYWWSWTLSYLFLSRRKCKAGRDEVKHWACCENFIMA